MAPWLLPAPASPPLPSPCRLCPSPLRHRLQPRNSFLHLGQNWIMDACWVMRIRVSLMKLVFEFPLCKTAPANAICGTPLVELLARRPFGWRGTKIALGAVQEAVPNVYDRDSRADSLALLRSDFFFNFDTVALFYFYLTNIVRS
ncbi:hypothetical protein BDA96_09G208300 [Sorghum bicolor]|uniref:Uncharacterized protein n=1 Tax=Sorghum bicolor TaxID=4558 RepID=A0A921U4T8_SORBI|nr:hypothetical protein BDA96_09G208300 [Sorghum bicolor]